MTTKSFTELTKNLSTERKAAIAAETAKLLKKIQSSKATPSTKINEILPNALNH